MLAQITMHAEEFESERFLGLRLAPLFCAPCLIVSSLCLRRRPDVYLDGRLVDRIRTMTALQRFTWGSRWTDPMTQAVRLKGDITSEDLPKPGADLRASNRAAALRGPLARHQHERRWWIQLAIMHHRILTFQSILAVAHAFATQLTPLVTLALLKGLERGECSVYMWSLVAWTMLVAMLTRVSPSGHKHVPPTYLSFYPHLLI